MEGQQETAAFIVGILSTFLGLVGVYVTVESDSTKEKLIGIAIFLTICVVGGLYNV